ncbi:heme exporter protein CcmB [Salmonella enterica]|uniref:heme exporter protein CcmB n=1 Tax=Salmonella enterica TaxID=28901 RepID=UPI0020C806C1|nr:heme exporter protein CcmB [Salmonella enterica]
MWRVFCLELRVAFRHGADIAGPLWFFLMVITLFPLSVGPQPQLLARIAPGINPGGGAAWPRCWRWSGCFATTCWTAAWSS